MTIEYNSILRYIYAKLRLKPKRKLPVLTLRTADNLSLEIELGGLITMNGRNEPQALIYMTRPWFTRCEFEFVFQLCIILTFKSQYLKQRSKNHIPL